MRLKSRFHPDCCEKPFPNAEDFSNLFPTIMQEYTKIYCRHKDVVTKNPRISNLATPNPLKRNFKYQPACICPKVAFPKVELIHLDAREPTRTVQLSYPHVGRLIDLRAKSSYAHFSRLRKLSIDDTLHKSLSSMYSRLTNVNPLIKPIPKHTWSKEEWRKHMEYIGKLAKPKKQIKLPQKTPKCKKNCPKIKRYKKLAKPKLYPDNSPKKWYLSDFLKTYVPTQRLLTISKPRKFEVYNDEDAFHVKRTAFNYRPTERIKMLAIPAAHHQIKSDAKENPFNVSHRALKGKASDRIIKLADPKTYSDTHTRPEPFSIKPAALKAKMTPRLIELSKPRVYSK